MKIEIISPSKAILIGPTPDDLAYLRQALTYTNTSVQHQIKRTQTNIWFKRNNPEGWKAAVDDLKSKLRNTLLWNDGVNYWIRPGSIPYLTLENVEIVNSIQYPAFKKIAWAKPLKYELYPYQEIGHQKLLEAKHGSVSFCTASGKTLTIMKMVREMGLDCVIVVPAISIQNEIVKQMEYHFGTKYVGAFGGGKKNISKKFTVAVSDSIANLQEGTKEYEFFKSKQALFMDEVHTFSSETLEKACYGVLSDIPFRFGFTATHTRSDGALILLQSITGPIVHTLTTAEAVAGGYISPHDFKIVNVAPSNKFYNSKDAMENKRVHFLRNSNIAEFAANLANAMALKKNEQTLILVEELNQIAMILPLLKVPYAYAHSETNKAKLVELQSQCGVLLEKVDTEESIEKFNKNEAKVLIGTSCIHVGVNVFAMTNTVAWIGGTSEVKAKQASIGRSVRLASANPWKHLCGPKTNCTIWDFNVEGNEILERHLKERLAFYEESQSTVKFIKLK